MTDSVIGALRVVFGADTVELETSLKKTAESVGQMNARMQAMGQTFARLGTVLKGALIVGAVNAVTNAVNRTMEQFETFGQVADQLAMPVETLTALKYAAERTGSSFEGLSMGVRTLMKSMAAAAADGRSGIGQAFASIGVAVTNAEGRMRSSTDVMMDVAEKFSRLRDGAGKTALAMQLFGDEGAKLLPMLNRGKAGINELMEQARQLGLVVGANTVDAAKRYNDAMSRMTKSSEGLMMQIAGKLAPSVERLSKTLDDYTTDAGKAGGATDLLADSVKGLEIWSARLAAQWRIVGLAYDAVFGSGSWEKFREGVKKINAELDATEREINATEMLRGFAEAGARIKKGAGDAEKAVVPLQGALRKLREEFNYQFSDPFAGVQRKLEVLEQGLKSGAIAAGEYRTMLRQVQVEDMGQLREAAKATLNHTLADGAVTAAQKMEALSAAVRAGTISFAEFSQYAAVLTKERLANVQATLDAFSSGMADAFSQFTESGKVNFKDMTASILKDLARITFQMSVLKPLFGDGGSNSGLLGNIVGNAVKGLPGFADGGRPPLNMPSIVGERGRELFWPDAAGTVIPNHLVNQLQREANNAPPMAAPQINLNIDARGATPDAVEMLRTDIPRIAVEAVNNAFDRGLIKKR